MRAMFAIGCIACGLIGPVGYEGPTLHWQDQFQLPELRPGISQIEDGAGKPATLEVVEQDGYRRVTITAQAEVISADLSAALLKSDGPRLGDVTGVDLTLRELYIEMDPGRYLAGQQLPLVTVDGDSYAKPHDQHTLSAVLVDEVRDAIRGGRPVVVPVTVQVYLWAPAGGTRIYVSADWAPTIWLTP